MKIAICVCFSEKNISHHKKILRDINQIIIPKGYHLKFYAVLNQNVLYLNNLITRIIDKKEIDIKVLTSFHISKGLCSTHPSFGKNCVNSFCIVSTTLNLLLYSVTRELVVP